MKQLLQNLKTGEGVVADVPAPVCQRGRVIVRAAASLVSAGTERAFVELGRKGLVGKAKVQLKGKGATLPALPLPLTLPATVQLQSESGQCWQGTFSASGQTAGDNTQFKGRGQ